MKMWFENEELHNMTKQKWTEILDGNSPLFIIWINNTIKKRGEMQWSSLRVVLAGSGSPCYAYMI